MRYKFSVIFLLILFINIFVLTSSSFAYQEKVIQARMYLTPEIKLKKILPLQLDIIRFKPGEYLEFITNTQQVEDLREKGYKVEIIHEDLVAFYRSQLDTTMDMGGFHTYEETGYFLDSMHTQHPSITTDTIPIGYSWENRSIWAFKISDNPEIDEDEPEILYTGLHHAREPMSIEVLLHYISYLLTNYGTDPEATDLVNNTEMWFVVIINPDGYEYNRQEEPGGGGMWRKNRRDNGNGTYGVDPNRNYGFMWGYDDIGSSPNTSSETYRGPAPFSEPEIQTIRDFSYEHDFIVAINYHSVAEMFLLPWGYTYAQPADYLVDEIFGDSATYYTGYWSGPGWEGLYPTNGESDDWHRGEQTLKTKVFAYTPELGMYSFWPPAWTIPVVCDQNLEANKFYARMAQRLHKHSIRYAETDPNFYYVDTSMAEDSTLSFNIRIYNHDPSQVMYYNIATPDSFSVPLRSSPWLAQENEKYESSSFASLASTYDIFPGSFGKSFSLMGDWLKVDEPTGTIPVDSYKDFAITLDGTVIEGDYFGAAYTGGLVIATSNDLTPLYCDTSLISVYLTLHLDYWNQYQYIHTQDFITNICNNTSIGQGMNFGMEYIPNTDNFLNEGSFFAAYVSDQGDTIVHRDIFRTHSMRATCHLSLDSTSDPRATHAYYTAITDSQDLGIIGEMIAPSHPDTSDFFIVKYKIYNTSGSAIDSLYLGMVMDWNVVQMTNGSGFDESVNLIWQSGRQSYAGLSYLSQDPAYGASIINNQVYVLPYNDFRTKDLFQFVSTPGFHADVQQKELSSVMTSNLVDLGIDDTAEVDFILVLSRTGEEDLKQSVIKARLFAGVAFARGDANGNGEVEISDAVYLVNYLFKSGPEPIPTPEIGDVDCDGEVIVADVVYLVNYLFRSGPPPCIQ